jgi:hypothetical protein
MTIGESRPPPPYPPWLRFLYFLVGIPLSVSLILYGFNLAWSGFSHFSWAGVGDPMATPELRSVIEGGVPPGVLAAYDTCSTFSISMGFGERARLRPIPPTCSLFPVTADKEWTGSIGMASLSAISGLWDGKEARLSLFDPFEAEIYGESHSDHWDRSGMGLSGTPEDITPWIKITIPPLPSGAVHKYVRGHVSLVVEAPVITGSNEYQNKTLRPNREFQFFVVTQAEMEAMDAVYRKVPPGELLGCLGVCAIFLIAGAVILGIPFLE